MQHPGEEFYEERALEQQEGTTRDCILKWKGVNLANLYLRTLKARPRETLCEIGGAEGVVPNAVGFLLEAASAVNFEISSANCAVGKDRYPHIEFRNQEFNGDGSPYDMILLSDIAEHVEDDGDFMEMVSRNCRYLLAKIPVEECLMDSRPAYSMRGRRKPAALMYGSGHIILDKSR